MPLATPDTVWQVSDGNGAPLLRVDNQGNFFVRDEEVASTTIIRDAFKDFATKYMEEQARFRSLVSIRSSLPGVYAQFPTDEAKKSPECMTAVVHAQLNPIVDMNYTGTEVNVHCLLGVLEEIKTSVLRNKHDFEMAQVMMARQLREQSDALKKQQEGQATDPTGAASAAPGEPAEAADAASTSGDATASDASSASSTDETQTSPPAGETPATSSGDENSGDEGQQEAQ